MTRNLVKEQTTRIIQVRPINPSDEPSTSEITEDQTVTSYTNEALDEDTIQSFTHEPIDDQTIQSFNNQTIDEHFQVIDDNEDIEDTFPKFNEMNEDDVGLTSVVYFLNGFKSQDNTPEMQKEFYKPIFDCFEGKRKRGILWKSSLGDVRRLLMKWIYDLDKDSTITEEQIDEKIISIGKLALDRLVKESWFTKLKNRLQMLIINAIHRLDTKITKCVVDTKRFADGIKSDIKDHSYLNALENTFIGAEKVFEIFQKNNEIENQQMSFVGFSLGTQFIFNIMELMIKEDKYYGKIDNVVLMGGVLDQERIRRNFDELLGDNGLIKGNLVIMQSRNDKVLKYLIKYACMNFSFKTGFNNSPVGYKGFDFEKAAKFLQKSNDKYKSLTLEEIHVILIGRIKVVDISLINNQKINHTDYEKNMGELSRLVQFQLA